MATEKMSYELELALKDFYAWVESGGKLEENGKIFNNKTKEWVTVKYTVTSRSTGKMKGISYETYQKFPAEIDAGIAKAKETREKFQKEKEARQKKEREENDWVVRGLAGQVGYLLSEKMIPRDLFFELQRNREISYRSREDLEEFDEWGEVAGWRVSDAGYERVRKAAEKVATPEQRAIAERLIAERRALDRKYELRDRAKKIAEKMRNEIEKLRTKESYLDPMKEPEESRVKTMYRTRYHSESPFIDDPLHPRNIYGGGSFFVFEPGRVLICEENGGDGDDWSANNLSTGGAGAIAWVAPKEKEALIREYIEIAKIAEGDRDADAAAEELVAKAEATTK